MIKGIGPTSPTRIGQVKDARIAATPSAETVTAEAPPAPAASPSLVAALAEAGPPINDAKIKAIRDAIAAGRYPLDAKAIAAKMIALDLPKADA